MAFGYTDTYLVKWLETAGGNVTYDRAILQNRIRFECKKCGDTLAVNAEDFDGTSIPYLVQEFVKTHAHKVVKIDDYQQKTASHPSALGSPHPISPFGMTEKELAQAFKNAQQVKALKDAQKNQEKLAQTTQQAQEYFSQKFLQTLEAQYPISGLAQSGSFTFKPYQEPTPPPPPAPPPKPPKALKTPTGRKFR